MVEKNRAQKKAPATKKISAPVPYGDSLRAWRHQHGWSQNVVAHLVGISAETVKNIEQGRVVKPSRGTRALVELFCQMSCLDKPESW